MWERWLSNPVLFCSSFCARDLTWAARTSAGNSVCSSEAMSPRSSSGSGIASHLDKTVASAFVWCPKLLWWHKEAAVLLAVHLVFIKRTGKDSTAEACLKNYPISCGYTWKYSSPSCFILCDLPQSCRWWWRKKRVRWSEASCQSVSSWVVLLRCPDGAIRHTCVTPFVITVLH